MAGNGDSRQRYGHNIAGGNSRVQYGNNYNNQYNDYSGVNVYPPIEPESPRRRLLRILSFKEMDVRQDTITEATPNTLDWVFERSGPPTEAENTDAFLHGGAASENALWDNFEERLREDSSIYWICGKAGSGKSTLMAHIVKDKRTKDNLKHWSEDKDPCILSFFFWRPGTPFQRSTQGLLQSLLHQICSLSPTAMAATINYVGEQLRTWTDRRLIGATVAAISGSHDYFCLFIDGLDEYSGDVDYLLELLGRLKHPRNAKACVSSRPEADFVAKLSSFNHLCLEHLNKRDIQKFVEGKLESLEYQIRHRLTGDIVERAAGVFLWVVLVTQSLIHDARKHNTLQMLIERLDEMPKEIEALFSAMIKSIDPRYKEWLRFYLTVMQLQRRYGNQGQFGPFNSISYITAALFRGRLESHDAFEKACKDTEAPVAFRSAGLLEIDRSFRPSEGEFPSESVGRYEIALPSLQNRSRDGFEFDSLSLTKTTLDRRRSQPQAEFPEFLVFEYRYLA